MNKLKFKIIIFFIFINIINCTKTNFETMINDLKKEFKSLESNVNKKLNDFKQKKAKNILNVKTKFSWHGTENQPLSSSSSPQTQRVHT